MGLRLSGEKEGFQGEIDVRISGVGHDRCFEALWEESHGIKRRFTVCTLP